MSIHVRILKNYKNTQKIKIIKISSDYSYYIHAYI